MANSFTPRSGQNTFQALGSFVLVVACLYWAQKILIPLALAVLLAFILFPFVIRLQRLGLGRIPSVLLVVVVAFSLLGVMCWAVAVQLTSLLDEVPKHREDIAAKLRQLQAAGPNPVSSFVGILNEVFQKLQTDAAQVVTGKAPQPVVVVQDKLPTLTWVASAASAAVEFLLAAFFVIILVIFMLARREDLRNRFFRAVGQGQLALVSRAIDTAAQRISSYLRTQLMVNVGLGLVWSLFLVVVPDGAGGRGVPYALLWGAVLAVLRFIPYVGTWVALAFPLLVSITLSPVGHPWLQAQLLAGVFTALELLTFNVIEPLLFGRNTGVSPLALLIAAIFWSWLWGPIGLVLSTPLTVCLIVFGQFIPQLRLLHALLGPDASIGTETSYYQRLLVRDEDEATAIVQQRLKNGASESLYDELLLPTLSLAHQDAERGSLGPHDEQFILDVTRRVVDEIACHDRHGDKVAPAHAQGRPSLGVGGTALVLACPARGEADELALHMLRHLLQADSHEMEILSDKALTSEVIERVRTQGPVAACISSLPPGGLAQASYLCKRLRRHFPDLQILVGRWGQTEDFEKTNSRLKEAGATKVLASLREMREEVRPHICFRKSEVTQSAQKKPARSAV
jgi:predicted PurR-regulated permease PerM